MGSSSDHSDALQKLHFFTFCHTLSTQIHISYSSDISEINQFIIIEGGHDINFIFNHIVFG